MADSDDNSNYSSPFTIHQNAVNHSLDIIDMINAYRVHQHLSSLRKSFKLSDIASIRNRDQALNFGRMSPCGSNGSLVEDRLNQGGVMFKKVCEYVVFGMHWRPADVLEAMKSSVEGLREFHETDWNEIGVDTYIDANGGVYVTVIFCLRQYCTVHTEVPCGKRSSERSRFD